jgi:hypothetical protein
MPPIKVNIPQVGAVNFPDGMSADEIQSAVGQIYSQALASNPPPAAGPQIAMQHSALGDLAPRAVPRSTGPNTQADFPGFEGSYASGDEGKAAAMTGVGLATGAALVSPALAPVGRAALVAGKWAGAHPVVAAMGYHLARELGIPLPKIMDVMSKFNPGE